MYKLDRSTYPIDYSLDDDGSTCQPETTFVEKITKVFRGISRFAKFYQALVVKVTKIISRYAEPVDYVGSS